MRTKHRGGLLAWMAFTGCVAARAAVPGATPSSPYEAIDRHALAAPIEVEASIPGLAAYLTKPARNEAEKARALFRWITDRVAYDTSVLSTGLVPESTPESSLHSHKAVCFGYSGLFQRLAEAAGLEAAVIQGFGKGYHYVVGGDTSGPSNHAWNAVKINGEWKLLDCTWGSGRTDEHYRFIRRFDGHYFLTPPRVFAMDHFPEDPRWQLLDPPMTRREFEALPYVQPAFFLLGLSFPSPEAGILHTGGRSSVTLRAPSGVALMAKLVTESGEELPRRALVQGRGETVRVLARCPGPGKYVLRILARRSGRGVDFDWAVDFLLVPNPDAGFSPPFPLAYEDYVKVGAALFEPLDGKLAARGRPRFRISVPGASEVVVVSRNRWHRLREVGGVFTGRVRLKRGPVAVAAKFPGRRGHQVLLRFRAY